MHDLRQRSIPDQRHRNISPQQLPQTPIAMHIPPLAPAVLLGQVSIGVIKRLFPSVNGEQHLKTDALRISRADVQDLADCVGSCAIDFGQED